MRNVFTQLKEWSTRASRVELTPSIIDKLGVHAPVAQKNNTLVDIYTFAYDVNGVEVSGYLAVPKNIDIALPAVIFNRGGTGDYGLIPKGRLFTRIADIASWGYVVVGSQYPGNSLSDGVDERGGKSDIASVLELRSLIQKLDIADDSRIGMVGESRGGMMTYLCLRQIDWIRGAVVVGGLANLERSLTLRPEMKTIFEQSFGNTAQGIIDRSAVKWASKLHKSPLCILHGSNDDKVSPLDALEMATELQKNGHPYELHIIRDGNHGLTNLSKIRDSYARQWLNRYVKGENDV